MITRAHDVTSHEQKHLVGLADMCHGCIAWCWTRRPGAADIRLRLFVMTAAEAARAAWNRCHKLLKLIARAQIPCLEQEGLCHQHGALG